MRSRRKARMLRGVGLAGQFAGLLLAGGVIAAAHASAPVAVLHAAGQPSSQPTPHQPSAVEISKALEAVKKDPNLSTEMTVKTLRWIGKAKPKTKSSPWPLFGWLRELVRWFERSARFLMWAMIAILAGWLAVYVIRMFRGRARRDRSSAEFVVPTHVRDLDIRPEALPADIGAAARALWDRGEHRAALALLYRGLLSRLVHAHRVPIRDSSTEGDCLELAADHLAEASRRDYAARLIRIWQHAVYGSQDPAPAAFYDLCDTFARSLDLAASAPSVSSRSGGAA